MEHQALVEKIFQTLPQSHPLFLLAEGIKNDTLRHHAFLLTGSRWQGQYLWAEYLALLERQEAHPELHSLEQSMDVYQLRDRGEVIPMEEALHLREALGHYSRERRHIVLIENIERLNSKNAYHESANTLLKVIEEPPAPTLFLFTTSAEDVVLPTILSRVQKVDVPMLDGPLIENIFSHEGLEYSPSLGNRIELLLSLQEEKFKNIYKEVQKVVTQILRRDLSISEKMILLLPLFPNAEQKRKEAELNNQIFSTEVLFFFCMEVAIEEGLISSTMSDEEHEYLYNIYVQVRHFKKDIAANLNKKLAIGHFLISCFL